MNKDIIVGSFSDTHVKTHKKNSRFFDDHVAPAFETFYDECIKRNVDIVVHCGDFYHLKDIVTTEALVKSFRLARKISEKFPTFYLVGNHDSFIKNEHSMHLLETFKPISTVIDMDYEYKDINDNIRFHFIPYLSEDKYVDVINNKVCLLKNGKNFLFSHVGIRGFTMQVDGYTDQYTRVHKGMFKKFDWAWFGHFHFHQTQDNCTYISSPFQSRHGDEKGDHGFVFFNTNEPEKFEFVENKKTPRFITITLEKKNLELINNLENHFIRLIIRDKKIGQDLLIRFREKLKKKNYDVRYIYDYINKISDTKIATIEGWQDIVHEDPEEILTKWVVENEENIEFDINKLLSIIIDVKD